MVSPKSFHWQKRDLYKSNDRVRLDRLGVLDETVQECLASVKASAARPDHLHLDRTRKLPFERPLTTTGKELSLNCLRTSVAISTRARHPCHDLEQSRPMVDGFRRSLRRRSSCLPASKADKVRPSGGAVHLDFAFLLGTLIVCGPARRIEGGRDVVWREGSKVEDRPPCWF